MPRPKLHQRHIALAFRQRDANPQPRSGKQIERLRSISQIETEPKALVPRPFRQRHPLAVRGESFRQRQNIAADAAKINPSTENTTREVPACGTDW